MDLVLVQKTGRLKMILILAALKEEVRPILSEMDITETVNLRPAVIARGGYLGREIVVAHTGIGSEKMRRAASFCIKEYAPELSINIGYCGALSPSLSLADIVAPSNIIHEKNEGSFTTTDFFNGKMDKVAGETGITVHRGTMLTVDKVVGTPHEKAFLGTKFGAIAVDMESFGLASVATEMQAPFMVLRSIIDPMDMHLPAFDGLVSDDGTTSPLGIAAGIVIRPQKLWHLPQLKFCAGKARETMTRFLNELIRN